MMPEHAPRLNSRLFGRVAERAAQPTLRVILKDDLDTGLVFPERGTLADVACSNGGDFRPICATIVGSLRQHHDSLGLPNVPPPQPLWQASGINAVAANPASTYLPPLSSLLRDVVD